MPKCSVKKCKNNTLTTLKRDGISYFRFPTNPDTKELWIEATGRIEWMPTKTSTICSQHFAENDYVIKKSGKKYLKSGASPHKNIVKAFSTQDEPSSGNEIKVFCPNCNTEISHTAEGIQEDQTKIIIAKVYHYFEHEYEELKKIYKNLDLTPLSMFSHRTAVALGVSETTVLQILKEEEERNAAQLQDSPEKPRRAYKRSRQTDSMKVTAKTSMPVPASDDSVYDSSEEDTGNDNVDEVGQSRFVQLVQNESEIETLVVKLEPPEEYKELAESDPISIEVKTEPPDDDEDNANETLALNEPADTKRKARKIPRINVTFTRQHTQGESSTTAAASSVRLTEQLDESGLLGETKVKEEQREIGEEGFS